MSHGDHPYPSAERVDVVDRMHGEDIPDPYRYFEDPADPRTESWSAAQDALFGAARDGWAGREAFRERLTTLHAVGDVGAPVWRGDRAFVHRRRPDQDHAVFHAIDPDGTERAVIDPAVIDPALLTTLDVAVPSPDGTKVAYVTSSGGTEIGAIRVRDVATGEDVDGPIDRVRYSDIAWLPSGDGFYYVRQLAADAVDDDPAMHRRAHLHRLGTDPDKDEVIFGEGAPRATYFDVNISRDGRWLWVHSSRGTDSRNDVWLADRHGDGTFVPVQVNVDAESFMRIGTDGVGYVLTNRDAPRWRICAVDPAALVAGAGYESWRTLIAEDPGAVLTDYAILDGDELPNPLMVVVRARHAVSEVSVHDLAGGAALHDVTLPGIGSITQLTARRDGGHEAWLGYTDYTTPNQIMRYDATAATLDLWAAPAGRAEPLVAVTSSHETYPSYDGTDVRMWVVTAADRPGPAPTILYGYGGFNISRPPTYDPWILAWVEAGGAFANACLRGGGEEGEEWHRAGMRERKQNVFDDLHAASDHLVARGVTTRDRLGIFGGSNGGLLVGAALTQHPEKYAAVVCSAPLLDMLRYEEHGLGPLWTGEYGTVADPTEFGWLRAYSPYHHVVDGVSYPPTLFTVFEGDSRVDLFHARKMCAAMQHASTGGVVLYRRETGVGHAKGAVSRTVGLAADRLAFFAHTLGI